MIIRSDIADHVKNNSNAIALELGTGEGKFTEHLVLKDKFVHVYSIDSWENLQCPLVQNVIHDDTEYKKTLTRLDIHKEKCSVFRLTFENSINLFPDQYFDFIYIDGNPINGENYGKTFEDWLPKLKKDGILAGSNCSKDFPLLVEHLESFSKKHNYQVHVHDFEDKDDEYSKYPSWYIQLDDSTFEFPQVSET